MITERSATRSDYLDFYGSLPSVASRATVWEKDGEVVAILGHYTANGIPIVFSDIKEGVELPKVRIWREAEDYMSQFKVAYCFATENSCRFLERLGWRIFDLGSRLYEWRA